ncbi:MAG TPA: NAD(P)H-binding protein, partial [Micropruina sp.]|nr:NAD(P)H-binding protein [Micropruina sp.]
AVIGGTGRMGRQVVSALEAQGVRAVSLSRRTGFDLAEGTGAQLAGKLEGCAAAVDCSEVGRGAENLRRAAVRLRQAAQAAGVQRLVVVSIVGVDRPGLARIAYYRASSSRNERSQPVRCPSAWCGAASGTSSPT